MVSFIFSSRCTSLNTSKYEYFKIFSFLSHFWICTFVLCGEMCRVLGVVCHVGCMCVCVPVVMYRCACVVWGVCVALCIIHLYPQSHVGLESCRSVETWANYVSEELSSSVKWKYQDVPFLLGRVGGNERRHARALRTARCRCCGQGSIGHGLCSMVASPRICLDHVWCLSD